MYAEVLIQYPVKSLDHTFTYHIPVSLEDIAEVGRKVYVPFGESKTNGFILNIKNECDIETKDIISIDTDFKLNEELLELGKYIKNKTMCTLITAYQAMLPTSYKINKESKKYDLVKKYIVINQEQKVIDEYIENNKRSTKQIELLKLLKDNRILKSDINGSSLKTLLDKGLVREEEESYYRINCDDVVRSLNELTTEQNNVYNTVKDSINTNKVFLLHGITGSGKTEVYMHLVEDVIKKDKTVIVLVPEISLTTQIVERFYNHFGNQTAIMHSNLSVGEKYDEYNKILKGEVKIVVGTRSAIFVPAHKIGLIIIDEEHTSSYKQEHHPRYNAIDIALWRAKYHNCPLILGSATPSLETMARAQKGVYGYLSLKNRIGLAKLPEIKIIDMTPEYKKRNNILSDELQYQIMKTLEKKEQVMLLINRRGFSTIMTCQSCGYTHKCPNCDITLTYHKTKNQLRCHYCGYTILNSSTCPECKEDAIRDFGLGSEKVEEYVKKLYPSYRVIRMDHDTTTKKGSHEKIIKAIENHEYDIIIGTQMISKGFDFPKVTLVGIINADESLNIPDFRSGENTFSLLSQVSGRAGRADLPGKVIIQTFNPDNKTLLNVLKNDYMSNYQYEMNIRKKLKYPPYYYLISIKVTSKIYESASREATKIAAYLKKNISSTTICLGPTTASPFRINNIYRFSIIIKYRFDDELFKALKELDEQYIINRDVNFEIDVDPLKI